MTNSIRALVAAVLFGTAACHDPNALPKASVPNVVDTLSLWSLVGGPLDKPTAYSLNARSGVRTWDPSALYEFIFSFDPSGRAILLPIFAVGLGNPQAVHPGLKPTTDTWDLMTKAPQNGYITSDTIAITEGERYYLRTGVNVCANIGVPLYGKIQILDIDTVAQTVRFLALGDQNCGYRGLRLGIPNS